MPSPSARPARLPWRRSPLLAAGLGWIVPGLGQLYTGRARKAALMLGAILPAFLLGWALSGFSAIDPDRYRLDFAAQILLGGPTLAARHWVPDPVLDHLPRWLDVGRLYVQVAGLLNLVAIADAVGEAIHHNRQVLAWRAEEAAELEDAAPDAPVDPQGGVEAPIAPEPAAVPAPVPADDTAGAPQPSAPAGEEAS